MTQIQWLKYTVTHGYEDIRWKKGGSLKIAFALILLLFFGLIADGRAYGTQFAVPDERIFNVVPYFVRSFGIFSAWVVGSRAVSTFFDGSGTFRNIFIYSSYALVPYIIQLYICVFLSHILIRDEAVFIQATAVCGAIWSAVLLFLAVKTANQYTVNQTFSAVFLALFVMIIMLCLGVLLLSLFQQIYVFFRSVFTEILYRIKV